MAAKICENNRRRNRRIEKMKKAIMTSKKAAANQWLSRWHHQCSISVMQPERKASHLINQRAMAHQSNRNQLILQKHRP
jgi:hypothetical protein